MNFEYILPRNVPRNPEPHICEGGDCGACVLAGLFDKSLQWAYEQHESGIYHNGEAIPKISSFSLSSMRNTLEGLDLIYHMTDAYIEVSSTYHFQDWYSFGKQNHFNPPEWFDVFRVFLEAGYYRICTVSNNGKGMDENNQLRRHMADHWIMINGIRAYWKDVSTEYSVGGRRLETEIHLSNSAKTSPHSQWVGMKEFLMTWGGMNGFWVKPF